MANIVPCEGIIDHMTPGARQFSIGLEGKNATVRCNINFTESLRPSEIKVKRKL
jgi:hypothetical protein